MGGPVELVQYKAAMPVPPGSVCEGCGGTERLGRDHCHDHGWVRGILCDPCNRHVGRIDKRILPRIVPGLLAALLAVRNRCPDCVPLEVADLHPFRAKTAAEKQRDWRDREARKRGDLEAENATLRARIEDLEALLTGATALIGHLSGDARDAARPVLEAS